MDEGNSRQGQIEPEIVYLGYNCFQRGFDDQRQIRIRMETPACQEMFIRAEEGRIRLVWSFMHEDETALCPFPGRKLAVLRLSALCEIRVGPNDEIYKLAKELQDKGNLSSKDAIHLACAIYAKARAFLTCDDKLIRQAHRLGLDIAVMNPIDYVRAKEEKWSEQK